jgi:hypothetical protein
MEIWMSALTALGRKLPQLKEYKVPKEDHTLAVFQYEALTWFGPGLERSVQASCRALSLPTKTLRIS